MDKKIVAAALKTSGHYIDVEENVLYITPAFNKKSEIYGTAECSRMNAILAAFPAVKVVVQKNTRKNDSITYEMMEAFIRIMPGAAANYAEFERVKKMSHAYRSAYKFVAAWFEKTFPHYGKLLVKDENDNPVWDAVAMYRVAEAEKAKEKDAAAPVEVAAEEPKLELLKGA